MDLIAVECEEEKFYRLLRRGRWKCVLSENGEGLCRLWKSAHMPAFGVYISGGVMCCGWLFVGDLVDGECSCLFSSSSFSPPSSLSSFSLF